MFCFGKSLLVLDTVFGMCIIFLYLQICSKHLTSYDPFITHENGKNHKKVCGNEIL